MEKKNLINAHSYAWYIFSIRHDVTKQCIKADLGYFKYCSGNRNDNPGACHSRNKAISDYENENILSFV